MAKTITMSLDNVIKEYKRAKKNASIVKELEEIFVNATEDTIELDENSPIVSFLLTEEITLQTLILNYMRSIHKNNSEIKQKLKKYILEYLNNLELGIDNSYIIEMIKEDKKLFEYIIQVRNEEELEQYLLNTKPKTKNVQLSKEKRIKGTPYIK